MKVFIVTGTPGTGKTTFAKLLARQRRACYIDVAKLIKAQKLYIGYDRSLRSYVADVTKVVRCLQQVIKRSSEDIVIDSHLSHYLPAKYVDRCYVAVCDLRTLRRRLQRRRYPKQKIRENMDAEILQVCLLEAVSRKHKVTVVDTSGEKCRILR